MIFYFTGTGNSRWTAEQIAAGTDDTAWDISSRQPIPNLAQETQIGLVFPVYAWGLPEPVLSFVRHLERPAGAFVFAVCTCGSEVGKTLEKLAQIYPLHSSYSLVMPNNYVVGSDVDDMPAARRKIDAAQREIKKIDQEVALRKAAHRVTEGPLAGLKSSIVNWGFNHFARRTKSFYATDACIACGLCARDCPAATISLSSGKPVWGKACYQCLRCINACPQQAIQYGKSTVGRGRYTIDRCLKNNGEGI